MRGMFLAAKLYDPTRPVLDVSGYSHRIAEADIYDAHDYTQDPDKFAKRYAGGGIYRNDCEHIASIPHRGQPYFVSEFGGIRWNPGVAKNAASWGYGDDPKTLEDFYRRFEGLCRVLLEAPHHFGYCYTELTDVFQEQNGLYTFDRQPKFDLARLRAIQRRTAAIEEA